MHRSQCLAVAALAFLVGGLAHPAGTRTQGTFVCGAGLEILVSGKPAGDCLSVSTGTVAGGTLTLKSAVAPVTSVTLGSCSAHGLYWKCPQASFANDGFCGAPAKSPVGVYVLAASLSAGGFTFSSGKLSVVCLENSGAPVQITCGPPPSETRSTAGDCLAWGFGVHQSVFNACVRMARADYLGTGESATRVGTWIQPYDLAVSALKDPTCSAKDSGLEALWYEKGAFCIYHYRWHDIAIRLVQIAGLSPVKVQKAGEAFSHPAPGLNADCIEAVDTKEELQKLAPVRNRSEEFDCSMGGMVSVTPCGICQGGFDPDCTQTCP
jgi:hypothetical protein